MSKPTPNNATKKTASARSAVVLIAACFVLAAVALLARSPQTTTLRVNGNAYKLSIADTDAARQKGLGGRVSMPHDAGMLFVFSSPGRQCFWMKDMRFALDMIWTDGSKRVVHVMRDLSPSSYPKVYCANGAQYVIELDVGQAAGIHIGTRLDF